MHSPRPTRQTIDEQGHRRAAVLANSRIAHARRVPRHPAIRLQNRASRAFSDGRNPLSDTTDVTSGVSDVADAGAGTTATATKRRRGGTGLSAMLLPELQSLAASLGISGTARMRKGELITAITERQSGGAPAESAPRPRSSQAAKQAAAPAEATAPAPVVATAPVAASAKAE